MNRIELYTLSNNLNVVSRRYFDSKFYLSIVAKTNSNLKYMRNKPSRYYISLDIYLQSPSLVGI